MRDTGLRVSRASAPWPGAGQSSSGEKRWWTDSVRLRRSRPAAARTRASHFPSAELFEASVDVAADFDEGDVGAEGEDLGAAAGAGGADAASGGEGVEGPVGFADPDVAGVGSFWDGGEGELRG